MKKELEYQIKQYKEKLKLLKQNKNTDQEAQIKLITDFISVLNNLNTYEIY